MFLLKQIHLVCKFFKLRHWISGRRAEKVLFENMQTMHFVCLHVYLTCIHLCTRNLSRQSFLLNLENMQLSTLLVFKENENISLMLLSSIHWNFTIPRFNFGKGGQEKLNLGQAESALLTVTQKLNSNLCKFTLISRFEFIWIYVLLHIYLNLQNIFPP